MAIICWGVNPIGKCFTQDFLICQCYVWRYLRLDNWYTYTIWHSQDRASWYVLIITQREALISQIYFWMRTLHISDSSSVHHHEFSTVHTATGICHTGYADCLRAGSGCSVLILLASCQQTCMAYHCCVYSVGLLMMDRDTVRNMSYSKNKFEKLVHLVGCIIRVIYTMLYVSVTVHREQSVKKEYQQDATI